MEALDRIFDLLSKERRRYVLYYLEQTDGPVHVAELADKINEWEDGSSPPDVPDGKFDRVALSLKHRDLPKAAEAEFIEYDPEADIVEISGTSPEFRAVLHVAEAIEDPGSDDILHLR